MSDQLKREFRLDARGQLDDVVVPDVTLFRMERMDKASWWIGLTMPTGERIVFWLTGSGRHIDATMDIEGP